MLYLPIPDYVVLVTLLALGSLSVAAAQLPAPPDVLVTHRTAIVATVVNTGSVELKLLNDPRTVLDPLETDTFYITDAAGNAPMFVGTLVKYVPEKVLEHNSASSFSILSPGASIEITHDLSKAYNFTASGESTYNIVASNKLLYVDPVTNSLMTIFANATGGVHTASLHGELAVSRNTVSPSILQPCTVDQELSIVSAVVNAETYASRAAAYLTANKVSTPRWATWFGTYSEADHTTVLNHFTTISAVGFANYTYECNSCTSYDVFAKVNRYLFGTIYLCPAFWRAPPIGTDSKAGTLVHESSHFNVVAGTMDYAYSQWNAQELARDDPKLAIANADSHEYFAENTPALT
ncbi:peptidyl-Lys metalloendopeptidase [Mycena leptocephala]|nr:peptidyl-Lys metalloendopeptidase [Mycena leptocephala]